MDNLSLNVDFILACHDGWLLKLYIGSTECFHSGQWVCWRGKGLEVLSEICIYTACAFAQNESNFRLFKCTHYKKFHKYCPHQRLLLLFFYVRLPWRRLIISQLYIVPDTDSLF